MVRTRYIFPFYFPLLAFRSKRDYESGSISCGSIGMLRGRQARALRWPVEMSFFMQPMVWQYTC